MTNNVDCRLGLHFRTPCQRLSQNVMQKLPTLCVLLLASVSFFGCSRIESRQVITTGQHIQVKKVDVSTPGWSAGRDWHSEYEITVAGKYIDRDDLKSILNKVVPDIVYSHQIYVVYEIAPDDVLFTVSTGSGYPQPATVIARAKYSGSGALWNVYTFKAEPCSYPSCIAESKIPGWIEIHDTANSYSYLHLIAKHSLQSYSFDGELVNIDYPYVVIHDERNHPRYKDGREFPEENEVLQVVNLQTGQTESELKFPKTCFSLPKQLNNVWDEYFNFDRAKKVVELKKERNTNLLKSKSRAEQNRCEKKYSIANSH